MEIVYVEMSNLIIIILVRFFLNVDDFPSFDCLFHILVYFDFDLIINLGIDAVDDIHVIKDFIEYSLIVLTIILNFLKYFPIYDYQINYLQIIIINHFHHHFTL